jgi:hypothetical protein
MGLYKPTASSNTSIANRAESRPTSYHAVEIRCTDDACDAAKAERGKRYLGKDAPTFPLTECDKRESCACRYRHLEDRRSGEDRRGGGSLSTGRVQTERRGRRDRRAEASLEDPTVTEAQVSLDDTYYGPGRR